MSEKFLDANHNNKIFFEYYTTDYSDGKYDYKLVKIDNLFYVVDMEDNSYYEDCSYDSLAKAIGELFNYSDLCYLKKIVLYDKTIIDIINSMDDFEYQKILKYIFNNPENEYLCFSEYCPPKLYIHIETLIDDEPFFKMIKVKMIDFDTVKKEEKLAEFAYDTPYNEIKCVYQIAESIEDQLKKNLEWAKMAYDDVSHHIETTSNHDQEDIKNKEKCLREVEYFTNKLKERAF